jgi:membrane-bound serine protease (ClpP class)
MDSVTLTLSLSLIALGMLLLLAELFLQTGVLTIAGLVAIAIGVVMPFYHGDTSTGVVTLIGVVIAVAAFGVFALHYWPKTAMGRRMFQTGPEEDATVASMPVIAELEMLRGRIGRAVSSLRPSGVVEFDGRRIDVLTEGIMVAEGTWVRCIEVKAGKVIVRPVDEPKLTDLENADFS